MLDSNWCIVGSLTMVMTLDGKLVWNSISNWLDSPHQESHFGYGFLSDGELWS